jgi:hypothetical protein
MRSLLPNDDTVVDWDLCRWLSTVIGLSTFGAPWLFGRDTEVLEVGMVAVLLCVSRNCTKATILVVQELAGCLSNRRKVNGRRQCFHSSQIQYDQNQLRLSIFFPRGAKCHAGWVASLRR